jgi:hypothetical protein
MPPRPCGALVPSPTHNDKANLVFQATLFLTSDSNNSNSWACNSPLKRVPGQGAPLSESIESKCISNNEVLTISTANKHRTSIAKFGALVASKCKGNNLHINCTTTITAPGPQSPDAEALHNRLKFGEGGKINDLSTPNFLPDPPLMKHKHLSNTEIEKHTNVNCLS